MKRIINLTQHLRTPQQREAGVIDLSTDVRARIGELLTFEDLPTTSDVEARAEKLAQIAADLVALTTYEDISTVMIGGAPYLMHPLEAALGRHGLDPVYAFSRRESVETLDGSGGVRKTTVFRHLGFVHAVLPRYRFPG